MTLEQYFVILNNSHMSKWNICDNDSIFVKDGQTASISVEDDKNWNISLWFMW